MRFLFSLGGLLHLCQARKSVIIWERLSKYGRLSSEFCNNLNFVDPANNIRQIHIRAYCHLCSSQRILEAAARTELKRNSSHFPKQKESCFDHQGWQSHNLKLYSTCLKGPQGERGLSPRLNNVLGMDLELIYARTNALRRHSIRSCSSSAPSTARSHGRVEVEDQPPSWLFVSPAVGGAYGAQVNLDLGLEERLSSAESLRGLEENLSCRGLEMDVTGLMKDLEKLKRMDKEKESLLSQRDELILKFKEIKVKPQTGDSSEKLGEHLRSIKAEISALKTSWGLEEKIMLNALKLPNDLHPSTPLEKKEIVREMKSKTVYSTDPASSIGHVEIAKKFNLIKFSNVGPKAYFLKGDLVLAEMALTSTVCDFLKAKGYRQMSGPEFVKTPIVEGCGADARDGNEVLTMVDPHKTVVEPMNHLTGISLHTFSAYVARTCIGNSAIPLKMFACGRRYQTNNLPGLFGAIQTTQAALFSCVTAEDVEEHFQTKVDILWEFLEQLGFGLRLCQVRARELRREEKRRVDLEILSPSLNQYIPVGSVSDVGDFISRRLMVTHNQNHADIRSACHLHMVHGTALNITSLLALWMEYSYTNSEHFALCHLPPIRRAPLPS